MDSFWRQGVADFGYFRYTVILEVVGLFVQTPPGRFCQGLHTLAHPTDRF